MVLIISTPGGNLVHKFDVVGEWPASNSISKSTEQTEKSGKSASPQITAHVFCQSFPNGMARTIWFSNKNFRFSQLTQKRHYSGGSRGGARGARASFFLDQTEAQRAKKRPPSPALYLRVWWRGFPPPLPEGLNPSLNSLAFSTFSISLSVQTSTVHGFAGLFIRQTPMANV